MKTPITCRYVKRIKTGDFEHEELEVNFAVSEEKSLDEELVKYKAKVYKLLLSENVPEAIEQMENTLGGSDGQESSKKSNEEISTEGKSESKKPISEKKSSSKKSTVKETPADSDRTKPESASPEEMEDVPSPFTKTEEKPKSKSKNTVYNRMEERHVDILTSYLTQLCGSEAWKKNPNITQFSISLVGKEFIDGEGNIVESFSTSCKEFFGAKSGL